MKILFLGTNVGTLDMIQYAHDNGAYVYVTDYLPLDQSIAKQHADEYLNVSTSKIESLTAFVMVNRIDAIFSGVSEFNLCSAQKISKMANKPFYFNTYQWNVFMNKMEFRKLCNSHQVRTPQTFFSGSITELDEKTIGKITFPVIVKPVDGAANLGISVCHSQNELAEAAVKAAENSTLKNIIIEQFLEGTEFSVTYVIKDKKCKLVFMGTKIPYENSRGLRALPHVYIYPSPQIDEYLNFVDSNVQKMILSQGINNCSIFFQGIYSEHSFHIFEAGLRLEGTASYRISDLINGQNYMKFMIDQAFGMPSDFNLDRADPYLQGKKCILFSLLVHGGMIRTISGLDIISKLTNISSFEQRHQIGDIVLEDGSLRQIMFRFVLIGNDIDEIIDSISLLISSISVKDEKDRELLIKDFNPRNLK